MIRFGKWLAVGLFAMIIVSGCGSSSPTVNPTPIITSASPEHAIAGSGAFQISVVALDIVDTSVVNWNGSPRTTTPDPNTGQLIAQILATDVATPGTAEITVVTPTPGGGTSNGLTFFIDAPDNPVPAISGLNPSSATPGGAGVSLTVTGTGFISSSSVNWNGSPRATTFGSATTLTAAILASDIAAAGTANVTVTNPAPGGGTSPAATFNISNGAAVPTSKGSFFALVSASVSGDAANGPSGAPRMDETGRFVAFESTATNLIRSGARAGVFVRDTCAGAANCTSETQAVDIGLGDSGPNAGLGRGLAISANGRFVAFSSHATNLVPAQFRNGPQIYLHDTCMGAATSPNCSPSTILISVALNGSAGDAASEFPSLSGDGRYVVFASASSNLVAGIGGGIPQIYLRDTCVGSTSDECVPRTVLISKDASGRAGKGASMQASVSRDGRYVAFDSEAPNLVAGTMAGMSNVFFRDTCLGDIIVAECSAYTALISKSAGGFAADGPSFTPTISDSGRYVAFATRAANWEMVDGTDSSQKIMMRDTCIHVSRAESCLPSTSLVSTPGSGEARSPFLSGDGRYITYVVDDGGAPGGSIRAYLRDTCSGALMQRSCTPRTTLLGTSGLGKSSQLIDGRSRFGIPVSRDGSVISFFSTGPVSGFKGHLSGAGDVLLEVMSAAPSAR